MKPKALVIAGADDARSQSDDVVAGLSGGNFYNFFIERVDWLLLCVFDGMRAQGMDIKELRKIAVCGEDCRNQFKRDARSLDGLATGVLPYLNSKGFCHIMALAPASCESGGSALA